MSGPAPALATVTFQGIDFAVDEGRPDEPARFVLGVRKSGSSMFNRIARRLALANETHWVDVPATLFQANIGVAGWQRDPASAALLRGGNVYGGYRECPLAIVDHPLFRAARKVLLVRDPRDALVSEYFSTAFTHSLPEAGEKPGVREQMLRRRARAQEQGIEAYVLANLDHMRRTLEGYRPLVDDPELLLLRYEEVVFAKDAMIDAMLAHFGWKLGPRRRDAILAANNVVPAAENPNAFIRKVTPGDHREKLSQATIAALDVELGEAMGAFGYGSGEGSDS